MGRKTKTQKLLRYQMQTESKPKKKDKKKEEMVDRDAIFI